MFNYHLLVNKDYQRLKVKGQDTCLHDRYSNVEVRLQVAATNHRTTSKSGDYVS